MIKIIGYRIEKIEKGRIDVYLIIELPKEFYVENKLNEEEYPIDEWSIWCLQEEEDRESKGLWIDPLLNRGMQTCFELEDNEIEIVYKYIKDWGIDKEAGFIL